jgi:hypothetical protein
MAVSEPKPGILAECPFQFQIGDTPHHPKTVVSHGLQRFTIQFHRTVVWVDLKSFAVIESERCVAGKTSVEHRFYISSLPPDAGLRISRHRDR